MPLARNVVSLLGFFALVALSAADSKKQDLVLYRHEARYAAFPSIYQDGDKLWVAFNWNTTRSHYGKAAGGEQGSVTLYSPDGGQSWLEKGKDAGFKNLPPSKAQLSLSDGTLINIGPMMHEVLPAEKKAELARRGIAVKEWPDGHISASYRVRMWRQRPGDEKAQLSYPEPAPFASMGGFGFGVVLPNNITLKPVYGLHTLQDSADSAWVLRSADKGDSWQLVDIANDGRHGFNEADLLALPDGRVLAMVRAEGGKNLALRDEQGFLWQTESSDGGMTWTPPRHTEMWGYPPTLLRLRNGDILCSYGYRRAPYGIRACFSHDGGRTWDTKHEVVLRSDALSNGMGKGKGSTSDLGYPRSVQLADGTIFTVYYITLGDGVTHVAATRWSPNWRSTSDAR